jgi:hypothetical protein
MKKSFILSAALASIFSLPAFAADAPDCLSNGHPLRVNNGEVSALKAKYYMNGGYTNGHAHIKGVISKVYEEFHQVQMYKQPDGKFEYLQLARYGQQYMEVIIDSPEGGKDTVTLYYNEDFGPLKKATTKELEGKSIEACGYLSVPNQEDYLIPDGALVQWTHENLAKSGNHGAGYLMIDGELFGQLSSSNKR